MSTPSILIADDHSIVRIGVSLIIEDLYPDAFIREADSFDNLLHQLRKQPFDLIVLDINIPGGNNHQMIHAVRLRQPEVKILVFSAYDEAMYAESYLKAGADGYLYKESAREDIRQAIRGILNDEKYISETFKQLLLDRYANNYSSKNPLTDLSTRETEVLHLLVKGDTLMSIARTLNLQLSTVSTYKTRLFEKMGVTNIVNLLEKMRLYAAG
ncbi:MAG: response regulator transcription factor [Candidatus Pseudobacter hemicellulosilyticus]|uniref:Response regulator transcription factor n=1 Tax=Candidatus Pseudobacter hemicellulosilyticus TaxID=3121375 RepID=A0AAJ5WVX4_9BACT|nr:MAG: response regulator transcription factor [Pseudobacter sp.]